MPVDIRKKLTVKIEILFVAAALIAAFAFYAQNSYAKAQLPATAEIYCDTKLVKTITLETAKDQTFRLPQKPNILFEIKNREIRFKSSDCPDKICVNTGFISKPGQAAACLPNKTVIKIVNLGNAMNSGADAFTQ